MIFVFSTPYKLWKLRTHHLWLLIVVIHFLFGSPGIPIKRVSPSVVLMKRFIHISHRYGLRRRNMNLIMETSTIKHRK